MRTFNFGQLKPVALKGEGILLPSGSRVLDETIDKVEKRINEEQERIIVPTNLSIRNIVLADFPIFLAHKNNGYIVLENGLLINAYYKPYKVIYDKLGNFMFFRMTGRFRENQDNLPPERRAYYAYVVYKWILDSEGNRLLQLDHRQRSYSEETSELVLTELISVVDTEIIRRSIVYRNSVVQKIKTESYKDSSWETVSQNKFPATRWKDANQIYKTTN